MTLPQIPVIYEGEGNFSSLPAFRKRADAAYTIGQRYIMSPEEQRSSASHRHQFAELREAWLNLPEHLAERFQSETALRKYALIMTGYCDKRVVVCASRAEARRVAGVAEDMDAFAVATVEGNMVTIMRALSQSVRAMGAKQFQDSKTAVLEYIAGLVGVTSDELRENAMEHA